MRSLFLVSNQVFGDSLVFHSNDLFQKACLVDLVDSLGLVVIGVVCVALLNDSSQVFGGSLVFHSNDVYQKACLVGQVDSLGMDVDN